VSRVPLSDDAVIVAQEVRTAVPSAMGGEPLNQRRAAWVWRVVDADPVPLAQEAGPGRVVPAGPARDVVGHAVHLHDEGGGRGDEDAEALLPVQAGRTGLHSQTFLSNVLGIVW
jgi:hypothetical protein